MEEYIEGKAASCTRRLAEKHQITQGASFEKKNEMEITLSSTVGNQI